MRHTNKYKILVVEDDELFREVVVEHLSDAGFIVKEASSGKSALSVFQNDEFDLIISDIQMADGDGIMLLESIRAIDPTRPIFFLMTGHSNFTKDECFQKGAQEVFSKPFKIEQVIDKAMKLLEVS